MTLTYVGGIPIETDKQMRPRDPDDFYETDRDCLYTYFNSHFEHDLDFCAVLDPGAGNGIYGTVLRSLFPDAELFGLELNDKRFPVCHDYDVWAYGDFLTATWLGYYEFIIGNPPYKHAEQFFWKAYDCLLNKSGTIDFLLRLGFLESERRYHSMWSKGYRPTKVTVLNTRPSFTGDGKTYPAAFAFFRWEVSKGKVNEKCEINFMTFERQRHDADNDAA